jgi:antirestriction protein
VQLVASFITQPEFIMQVSSAVTARIYVGTYGKYNAGSIYGKWLDLEDFSDKDEFYKACAGLHKDEEDPEFMFQDFEGVPASLINESWVSEQVWEMLELDGVEQQAFDDWLSDGNDFDMSAFSDAYQGVWSSEESFAENTAIECGYFDAMETAGLSAHYFDMAAFASDLFMDYWRSDKGNVFTR